MTTPDGSVVPSAKRRQLVRGKPQGVPWEPWQYQRLFSSYAGGTVLDTDWDVRAVDELIERDSASRKNEAVLTLPIRSAPWTITNAPGDSGEGDFARSVMSRVMSGLIDRCSNGFTQRKVFHELVWGLDGGKAVLDEVAWRPSATCRQAWTPDGQFDGFWQQVPTDYTTTRGGLQLAPTASDPRWPGWVRIEQPRSFVYIHGRHRQPVRGVSDLEVSLHLYEQRRKLTFLLFQFLELQAVPRVAAGGRTEDVSDARADALIEAKGGGVVPVDLEDGDEALSDVYHVIESGGRGVDQFLETIKWLQSEASNSILAGFTDLTGSATSGRGSYALSADQSAFFLQNRQGVADELAAQITDGVLRPLTLLNFGSDAAVPSLSIGPISETHTQRAFDLMKELVVSPQVNAPDGFVDLLIVQTAGYTGLSVDEVRKMVEDHQAEREAKQAAARLQGEVTSGSSSGANTHTPERPSALQQSRTGNAPSAASAPTALAAAIDLSHELVTRVREGQDPGDAMTALQLRLAGEQRSFATAGVALAHRVRTEGGVKRYHLPIGAEIDNDDSLPLHDALHDAHEADASRFVHKTDDGDVHVSDEAPEGVAHYRATPGGRVIHTTADGGVRPLPPAAVDQVAQTLRPSHNPHGHEDDDETFPDYRDGPTVHDRIVRDVDRVGSPEEQASLRRYTGNGYRAINGYLRGDADYGLDSPSGVEARTNAKAISELFGQYRMPENATVTRGLSDGSWLPDDDLTGRQIVNEGFVSTSFKPDKGVEFSDAAIAGEGDRPTGATS